MNFETNLDMVVKALEKALNVKLDVKESNQVDFLEQEKKDFIKLVNGLEKLVKKEEKVFKTHKIDTSSIVDPYWSIIEELLLFAFGEEAAELIMWYLNQEGQKVWEDEDGTQYVFKGSSDLYEFLIYRFNF